MLNDDLCQLSLDVRQAGYEKEADRILSLQCTHGITAASPRFVKDLKGRRIESPRRFYRGTISGGNRVVTGDKFWDSLLFMSSDYDSASWYGPNITVYNAKPTAKILYEGTKDFRSLAKGLQGTTLLEYCSTVAQRAKDAGYDIVWFKRQSDVGTAVLNKSSVSMDTVDTSK